MGIWSLRAYTKHAIGVLRLGEKHKMSMYIPRVFDWVGGLVTILVGVVYSFMTTITKESNITKALGARTVILMQKSEQKSNNPEECHRNNRECRCC